jgi:hypothetical protein
VDFDKKNSHCCQDINAEFVYLHLTARMVKLVDTLVSGAGAHKLAGSSPVPGTEKAFFNLRRLLFFLNC